MKGSTVPVDASDSNANSSTLIAGSDVGEESTSTTSSSPSAASSLLGSQLSTLIGNDLFADVYFEVDGHIVPAHRNILIARSEYFRAMLGGHSGHESKAASAGSSFSFRESLAANHGADRPIYIKNVSHAVFRQLIKYLYTGRVGDNVPHHVLLNLMRTADLMNLVELERVCLFNLSVMLSRGNVVDVFKEASETAELLEPVLQLCYNVMTAHFGFISRSAEFSSLPQELVVLIIQNIVPRLKTPEPTAVQVTASAQDRRKTTQPPASSAKSSAYKLGNHFG